MPSDMIFEVRAHDGDQGSLEVNTHADLRLNNIARDNGGRALVVGRKTNKGLVINYDNDFGGVSIDGLEPVPDGVNFRSVVVDVNNGRLYRE